MRLKVKNGSHRYDINGIRPKRGYKYTEEKMCPSMMMVMSNKQHLKLISWKSSATLRLGLKSVAYKRKRVICKKKSVVPSRNKNGLLRYFSQI